MSYIADTRIKKLKKSLVLSSKIIKKYGFRYYIYVLNQEFKKQGFRVFTPDVKPVPLFQEKNFAINYEKYIAKIENELKTKNSQLTNTDFSFVFFIHSTNYDLINESITSITAQKVPNVEILLISPISLTGKIKDFPNLKFVDSTEPKKIISEILNLTGEHIVFLNGGSILIENALQASKTYIDSEFDIFYSDHDYLSKESQRHDPFFKPNWSLFAFVSMDYLSPFYFIKKSVLKQISSDELILEDISFQILLKCIQVSQKVFHIPIPLCSSRIDFNQNIPDRKSLLTNFLKNLGINASVETGINGTNRIVFSNDKKPKVSIIIPTKNNYKILKRCIDSIKISDYNNYEIIIIDNDSNDPKLLDYYSQLPHKVISYNENFNFSKMNNLAVKSSSGELLLFLNDDTKVLDSFWLDELVSVILQENIGAVGPKLIYSDNTIQHVGIVFLKTGAGFHPLMKQKHDSKGYHNLINIVRDSSAVTGACLITRREIFDKVGGFDDNFDVYYGDADLCLKIISEGYHVVYTPFTKLLHEGSYTIRETNIIYFAVESHQAFIHKWPYLKNGDPFYHPDLDWDYSLSEVKN